MISVRRGWRSNTPANTSRSAASVLSNRKPAIGARENSCIASMPGWAHRMDEQRQAAALQLGVEGQELGVVQRQAVRVGAQHHAHHLGRVRDARQFAQRRVGQVQRHRREHPEARGMGAGQLQEHVVCHLAESNRGALVGQVDVGDGERQDLQVDADPLQVGEPPLDGPEARVA